MAATEDYSNLLHVSPALTKENLSRALSDWFKQDVAFTHWEYVSETGKGDSFMSEVMRIKIHGQYSTGEPKHVQVILKNIPRQVSRALTYRSKELFENEIIFYKKVLPALLKFQAKNVVKDPFEKYANIFYTFCDGKHDVICLEDASLQNFGSPVRQEGIDYDHCKLTIKTLAQYHAMSFAMRDQEPDEFAKISNAISELYYAEHFWEWYERFWKRLCNIAIDAVEKEYPDTLYLKKVKEFAVPEHYKKMIRAADDKTYGVISHGDCWTNNFLYKYENGKPVDAKMIDFQLARYASPILDLSFVFYACTTEDLREKYYDEFLKYYYDILSTQIREMGSDPDKVYSWDAFMGEVKKYSYFGLAFSFESTPFIVLAPEDAPDMNMQGDEKLNIDDIWRIPLLKTKEGRLREANNVKHCVDRGYI